MKTYTLVIALMISANQLVAQWSPTPEQEKKFWEDTEKQEIANYLKKHPDTNDLSEVKRKSIFLKFDNVTYCYLKKEGIEIILLHASNEEFYNFCLNNSFNIDCLMLQRYYNDGYVFEARSESKVVETLKVKEGIVNPNYSSYPIKENNYASFLWKYYGDERDKDKVAYIKYN